MPGLELAVPNVRMTPARFRPNLAAGQDHSTMKKQCTHCGVKLGIFRRDGFCSREHSEIYHQEQSMTAFRRILGIELESFATSPAQTAAE